MHKHVLLPGSVFRVIVLLLALLHVYVAPAQEIRFNKVLPPARNFSGIVGGITQDNNGYMWIATSGGLYRYDGYRFRLYANDPGNVSSLASSRLESVYSDRKGMIWIATWAEGVDRLDPATGRFIHFRHKVTEPGSLSNDTVRSILEDRDGTLWLGTASGLDKFDPATNTFHNYRHNPNDPRSLSCNRIRKLYEDKEGTLWIATGSVWVMEGGRTNEGGLNRFDKNTGTFIRYLHNPKDPRSLLNNKVQGIYEDSRGTFWVGTAGDGLHTMDRRTGIFERHLNNPAKPGGLSRPPLRGTGEFDHITSITEDAIGNIWIGTLENGIGRYNPKTGKTTHYGKKDTAIGFTDNSGWTFCNSRDGILWIGTWQGGLFRIDPFHRNIPHVTIGSNVGAFLEESDTHLWIGSGEGLVLRNTTTGASTTFVHDPSRPSSLSNNFIRCLFRDENKTIWVGTSNGLNRFNVATGNFTRYANNPDDPASIGLGEIYAVESAGADSLWVATDNGLDRIHKRTGACTHFRNNPKDTTSLSRNDISALLRDSSGNLWVGTIPSGGLNYLSRNSAAFKHFFTGMSILSLWRDASGTLWVGTDGAGVYRGNIADGFTKITAPGSGIEKTTVLSIQEDNQHNIWVRTESDIYRIHPPTGQTTVFGANYGVNTGNLNYDAGYKGRTGKIYFGDVNGYYVFLPEDLSTNPLAPQVVLNDLRIGGKSVVPDKDGVLTTVIEQSTEINLQYNQNTFVIDFAALHFSSPEQNRHLYKLEKYDPDWREAGTEKSATYYNVPPGHYVFRVKAASGEGVWAEKTIAVDISPPWWRTWWASLIYALTVVLAVRTYFKFYVNRARLKAQLNVEKLEAKRIKELDAVKTQLYTNITHEFRTPLTVILGMAQRVMNKPDENFTAGMNMIIRNGKSLLHLVNQMLDLSKLETGKMLLQPVNGDIIDFLRYVVESFNSFNDTGQKRLHFLTDLDELPVAYDPEKIRQIVANLISNALKFTPQTGHVYFSVGKEIDPADAQKVKLRIKVKDTGMGIPQDQLHRIFDRFYQFDGDHTRRPEGTGIGLALTRDLVKLMDGEIVVTSPPAGAKKGTEFSVMLRLQQVSIAEDLVINPRGKETIELNQVPPAHHENFALTENRNAGMPLILLVEDNADVVAYTASCLPDYRLAVGKDGQEGFDIATEIIPDIIITDVMMPFMDGFELCRCLKNNQHTSHIPIIILTAKADIESKIEGLEQGADAYLQKPFNKDELLVRVKKLLELRTTLQQYYLGTLGLDLHTPTDASIAETTLPESKAEDGFVKKIRTAIEANLSNGDFSVEQLSKLLFISHSQLHRKLEATTSLSPNKFIRMIRINKAKELLTNPAHSISSIAFQCGYNDPGYFARVFKQEYGVTPQQWRVNNKVLV